MKYIIIISFLFISVFALGQQKKWSEELARTAMEIWPDSFALPNDKVAKWRYDQGVILKGIEGIWNATGDGKWFRYIQKSMDFYLDDNGNIRGYRPDEYNIDHLNNGKLILLLYRVTEKEKYRKAAESLRNQLLRHPRTSEGGFWHKHIYPYQMWLDGLYMGQPFFAEYASVFNEPAAFDDITRQFVLMEKHSRDATTGLLYHGWDESRDQRWANKTTGRSPHVWGRALGWFGMAMVDVLDHFPEDHKGRDSIISILQRFTEAVTKVQDPETGLWFDIVDLPNEKGNYHEASASAMLTYTIAKAVRKAYIADHYIDNAKKAYKGILNKFIRVDNGRTDLHGTVSVSGLGGNPYRDGSFAYYMSEPVIVNDPKGMGAFIKAAVEMEMLPTLNVGEGKTVMLDNYFNNEWKKDAAGNLKNWHYTWNDRSNGGYHMLGQIFNRFGYRTCHAGEPGAERLKAASIYIIVDPDTEKETEKPNYIQKSHVKAIRQWVEAGGVLILLGNDSGNVEFNNFNQLAGEFGIRFDQNSLNRVKNDNFIDGLVVARNRIVFPNSDSLYIKEYSSIQTKSPAYSLVDKDGHVVIAEASYGKGTVIALGDPWVYNEYLDGRKLPEYFSNYSAVEDLIRYVSSLINNKSK